MRTALRVTITAVVITIAAIASPVSAQEQPSPWSISCFVDTSSMDTARNEFDSAMRRSLRSLGDVDVHGPDSTCQVSLLKLTLAGGSIDTHFVSVLVTYRSNFRLWLTEPTFIRVYGLSSRQAEMISQVLESLGSTTVQYFGIFSGTDPYEISRRIVSAIDTQVFENGRQVNIQINQAIQQAIDKNNSKSTR